MNINDLTIGQAKELSEMFSKCSGVTGSPSPMGGPTTWEGLLIQSMVKRESYEVVLNPGWRKK